ncbi:MAG: hypothetical protein IT446_03940 [Phycisphaerales bacterium]|nr:hypothetical protein [Phycisphaerales bacterium]
MPIMVSNNGGKVQVVHESGVSCEADLEKYVSQNPESLPLHEIKENARLMVIGNQFPAGRYPIDVLGIDADGDVYIIETKLFRNPDKRRVISQVLDYGAALWRSYSDGESFISEADRQLSGRGATGLEESLSKFFKLEDDRIRLLIENIRNNVQNGNFRFIMLMDHLHDELKELIQFLNLRSGLYFYAVEMEFYRLDGLEIVIPNLYGAETVKTSSRRSSASRRFWDEGSFFEALGNQLQDDQLKAVRKLYDFVKREGEPRWGSGQTALLAARFPGYDKESMFYIEESGRLSIWVDVLADKHKSDAVYSALLRRRAEALNAAGLGTHGRGNYPECWGYEIDQWAARVDKFIAVFEGLIRNRGG